MKIPALLINHYGKIITAGIGLLIVLGLLLYWWKSQKKQISPSENNPDEPTATAPLRDAHGRFIKRSQ